MENIKKQTVLCVDDDERHFELLQALLALEGYALKYCPSGESALAFVEKEVPDLILLDIMMPGLSGIEVLTKLRTNDRTRTIPVVLVTAEGSEEQRVQGLETGCDDFITKPFDLVELRTRVRSLLRISRYRNALDEKEGAWQVIHEMKEPLILCKTDWTLASFNRAARPYLMSGAELKSLNFLNWLFKDYQVPISWEKMQDCTEVPPRFEVTGKYPGPAGIRRLEVSLELLGNPDDEAVGIVIALWDISASRPDRKKPKGRSVLFPFGKKR